MKTKQSHENKNNTASSFVRKISKTEKTGSRDKFLTECGKHFVLTPEDLSNLYDLSYMITWQDYERVFKPNKMHKWFKNFFDRLEEVCLADKEDYSKVIMKQIKQSEDLRTKK